jgi:mannose-6-phosphate isomerase-like protein (cupin superfamily)
MGPGINMRRMDILAEVLDRIRLGGTLLRHFELSRPWSLALPPRSDALFHYLSRGRATLTLEQGREIHMVEGDLVVVTRGEPHVIFSDRGTKPFEILDFNRPPQDLWQLDCITEAVRSRSRK